MDQPKPDPKNVSPTPTGTSQFSEALESKGTATIQAPSAISEPTSPLPIRLISGAFGGVLFAILGGLVWALIAKFTDAEWSAVALLIGFGCGFGVNILSQGGKGLPFQLTAVVTSVFGILLGKYLSFYLFLKEVVAEEYGAGAANQIGVFSLDTISDFLNFLPEFADFYDVIWVGGAVYAAWSILKES